MASCAARDFRPYLGVGMGVVTVSTAATLIRLALLGADALTVAAWRLTLATLLLAPVALCRGRAGFGALTRREWGYAFAAGLLLAVHFATWIASLAYTSVAASVVLVTTSPIFVGLISHVALHDRLSRGLAVGLAIAVGGGVLIGLGDLGAGGHRLWGDALALLGALGAAGYFLIERRLRARHSLLVSVFPVYGVAALMLMGMALFSAVPVISHRAETWLWLFLLAIGPQIVGHSSLNWALRYLSATYVTIAILAEPIGATLLAWLLLGESPSLLVVAGGVLILIGITFASWAERARA